MGYGPIELVVIKFTGNQFTGGVAPALRRLVESGTIRVVDLAFILKDEVGDVVAVEIDALPPDDAAAYAGIAEVDNGLLSDEDFEVFAAALEPNSSAALICFENTWAAEFSTAVREANGEVVFSERIPGAVIAELEAAIG